MMFVFSSLRGVPSSRHAFGVFSRDGLCMCPGGAKAEVGQTGLLELCTRLTDWQTRLHGHSQSQIRTRVGWIGRNLLICFHLCSLCRFPVPWPDRVILDTNVSKVVRFRGVGPSPRNVVMTYHTIADIPDILYDIERFSQSYGEKHRESNAEIAMHFATFDRRSCPETAWPGLRTFTSTYAARRPSDLSPEAPGSAESYSGENPKVSRKRWSNSSLWKRWFCVPACSTLYAPARAAMRPVHSQSMPFSMP